MRIDGPTPFKKTGPLGTGYLASLTKPEGGETGPLAAIKPRTGSLADPAAERGSRNLCAALVKAFGAVTPSAQALYEVMTGGLTPSSAAMLHARGISLVDLRRDASLFAPSLIGFAPVGQILGAGTLSHLSSVNSLEELMAGPTYAIGMGRSIAGQLVGSLFPSPFDARLREAAFELLTQGFLTPGTASQLSPDDLRRLGRRLFEVRSLIAELIQPGLRPFADGMLSAIGLATGGDSPSAATLNAAVQGSLPMGMRQQPSQGSSGGFSATIGDSNASLHVHADASGSVSAHGNAQVGPDGLTASGDIKASARVEADAQVKGAVDLGGIAQASGEAHAGAEVDATIEADGKASIGSDGVHAQGHLGADVEAQVEAGASGSFSALGGAVGASGDVEGSAKVEAYADAGGKLAIGVDKNGLPDLDVGFDAKAGVVAEADAHGSLKGNILGFTPSVSGYAGVSAGIGAHIGGDVGIEDGQLHVAFDMGAALGIGVSFGVDFHLGVPPWLGSFFGGAAHGVEDVVQGVGSALGSGVHGVEEAAGAVGSAVSSVGSAIGDAASAVGNFIGGLF